MTLSPAFGRHARRAFYFRRNTRRCSSACRRSRRTRAARDGVTVGRSHRGVNVTELTRISAYRVRTRLTTLQDGSEKQLHLRPVASPNGAVHAVSPLDGPSLESRAGHSHGVRQASEQGAIGVPVLTTRRIKQKPTGRDDGCGVRSQRLSTVIAARHAHATLSVHRHRRSPGAKRFGATSCRLGRAYPATR